MRNKLRARSTFYTYLLSYVLILVFSLTGMGFVINTQLRRQFHQSKIDQNMRDLENRIQLINGRMIELNRLNYAIRNDLSTIMARYDSSPPMHNQAVQEMSKYISGNTLVRDVFYVDIEQEFIFSTKLLTKLHNQQVKIHISQNQYTFDLNVVGDVEHTSRLIRLDEPFGSLYLYIPQQDKIRCQIIFLLEETELQLLLNSCLSNTVRAAAIANSNLELIHALDEQLLLEKLNSAPLDSLQERMNAAGLVVYSTVSPDINILAYADMEIMEQMVSDAFRSSYSIMFLIAAVGCLFILLAMRMTYKPIAKVIRRITGESQKKSDSLQNIIDAFDDNRLQSQQLQEKIDNYRLSIQRSLLDSTIKYPQSGSSQELAQIDRLFEASLDNCLLIVDIYYPSSLSSAAVLEFLHHPDTPCDLCFLMTEDKNALRILLNYPGKLPMEEKESVYREHLYSLVQHLNCQVAASDCSTNPLDIARLYENIDVATHLSSVERPLVLFQDLENNETNRSQSYPYLILDNLLDRLEESDFDGAFAALDGLMNLLEKDNLPEFYVRCVLIDAITLLIGAMNRANIRFEKFSQAYFQALFLCRSSNYRQTGSEIREAMIELLEIYNMESENSSIKFSAVRAYIHEHYLSSDFTVTSLANAFHTSTAYMSFLFKKRTDMNLSDYIWQLRMEKAKELLLHTDYLIDKVSDMVGYDKASSFRRKFKEATGLPPSQFRKNGKDIDTK